MLPFIGPFWFARNLFHVFLWRLFVLQSRWRSPPAKQRGSLIAMLARVDE
jgi:hypothetical protein